MDTIRSSHLHSENTNLLLSYVFCIQKIVVTRKVVPLYALVKKAVYIKMLGVNFDISNIVSSAMYLYLVTHLFLKSDHIRLCLATSVQTSPAQTYPSIRSESDQTIWSDLFMQGSDQDFLLGWN